MYLIYIESRRVDGVEMVDRVEKGRMSQNLIKLYQL